MDFKSKLLIPVLFIGLSSIASADWFLSSETKAMIKRAESGDVDAQFRVGVAYDYGRGAPHDTKEAMHWYQIAADHGNAEAQNSIGSMLQDDKKYADAMIWYEKAASQGHLRATNSLAYLYDLGLGVEQDRQKAFTIYGHAADLGSAEAMWNIANMYGAGQLGPVDMLNACVWTRRAAKWAQEVEGRVRAIANRAIPKIESALSTDQQSACKGTAEEWKPASLAKPQN